MRCIVFSAYAEVVPIEHLPSGEILGILRVRGGSSVFSITMMWFDTVFSAYAEVVPLGHARSRQARRILRVRGGSSA